MLWVGTAAEYAEARQHVQRLMVAAWSPAFTRVYGSGRRP